MGLREVWDAGGVRLEVRLWIKLDQCAALLLGDSVPDAAHLFVGVGWVPVA